MNCSGGSRWWPDDLCDGGAWKMTSPPVALVTGGSRGIGRGICMALAREGFAVLVNYNSNIAAAEQTCGMIESAGGRAELCQGDISLPEHRALMLELGMETFGRLDLLVNNAAMAPAQRVDLLETSESSFDQVLATNLKA